MALGFKALKANSCKGSTQSEFKSEKWKESATNPPHIEVMKRDGVVQDRGNHTVAVHGSKPIKLNMEVYQQLVPGIPDEVTINKITPKLPWAAFPSLALVSHSWLRAIRSHHIHDARVRSRSTQTFVAFIQRVSDDFSSVVLYSMEDGSWRRLPPIPSVQRGIPLNNGCVFMNGKLYILGGMLKSDYTVDSVGHPTSAEVYVMDLAGLRKWEQCANMGNGRQWFGCCAKNEKIYVFGGDSGHRDKPISGSEVYDPRQDAWSPITPMPAFGVDIKVTVVGEELFVHDAGQEFQLQEPLSRPSYTQDAKVYNPVKDEWRSIKNFNGEYDRGLMVGEKLYNLTHNGIEVYDMDAGTWNDSQPIMMDAPIPHAITGLMPLSAVAIDNEILSFIYCNTVSLLGRQSFAKCLIRSQGLGTMFRNKKLVWQKLHSSIYLGDVAPAMCPIQL